MGIQRAGTLYPVNTTTVDTGGAVDIRLLDSAQAGADDDTQSVQWTHTQDNAFRTFDPANAGVTTANNPATVLGIGWGLRLADDMTPADDTNCNALLNAGTVSVSINVRLNQSGGTYVSGNYSPQWRFYLYRWDLSANTGTLIWGGLVSTPTWDYTPATGDLGTFKVVTGTFDVSDTEFQPGEILLWQIGLNTATVPNPTLGTATWTATLRVDNTDTRITWASGQGIRQLCALTESLTGKGESTRVLAGALGRSLVGAGTPDMTRAAIAAKTFDLVGAGVPDMTRAVVAAKTFDLTGAGTPAGVRDVGLLPFALTGKGEAVGTKAVVAAKSFDLVGKGAANRGINAVLIPRSVTGTGSITELHPVQAFRTFNLAGKGETTGRIEIPIDEVPELTGGTTTVRRPIIVLDD